MSWAVDTCVIIDVLREDSEFARLSADALDAKSDEGLVISPVTYVELAPSFNGNADDQDEMLSDLGIECVFDGDWDELLVTHKAWYEHIQRKHAGADTKRPIGDVLIGAFAMTQTGLITRNEADFRTLYPELTIYNPERPAA